VPAASVAILLRPTKSLGLYLQQVGRVLRPAPGKQAALILDHVGNVSRHGFPDDHRDWTLDDGIKRTAGTAAPSVRTCSECFSAFKPQPICPVCGAQCAPITNRKIRQLAGELQELKREAVQQRIAERRKQGTARTLEQLLALANERGYSPGWAYRIFHARGKR
jgi:superfamily II DNA or RNA helicase